MSQAIFDEVAAGSLTGRRPSRGLARHDADLTRGRRNLASVHASPLPRCGHRSPAGTDLHLPPSSYQNGGPVIDEHAETTLEGVFACGEIAGGTTEGSHDGQLASGVHGLRAARRKKAAERARGEATHLRSSIPRRSRPSSRRRTVTSTRCRRCSPRSRASSTPPGSAAATGRRRSAPQRTWAAARSRSSCSSTARGSTCSRPRCSATSTSSPRSSRTSPRCTTRSARTASRSSSTPVPVAPTHERSSSSSRRRRWR